jgi:hypothetical protein
VWQSLRSASRVGRLHFAVQFHGSTECLSAKLLKSKIVLRFLLEHRQIKTIDPVLNSIDQKAVRVPFAVAAKALDATVDDLTAAMFFDESSDDPNK